MMTKSNYDPYCYQNENVLINLLDIHDREKIDEYERKVVSRKLLELHFTNPIGKFDVAHYLAIHKYLFGDIYPFAGQIRTVDIKKGNTYFARSLCIRNALVEVLNDIKKKYRHVQNLEEYSRLLGEAHISLNIAHPFREGNGRSEREFLREYVLYLNQFLPFEDVELDYSKMDKEIFLFATVYMNVNLVSEQFRMALIPIEKQKHK